MPYCINDLCDMSLSSYLQLAYDIDKDADEQNSYLDGMVRYLTGKQIGFLND